MANITDSLIYINLPLSLKNVQKCIKCSRNAQMAKFVQNISFLQDIPGFVSFICANMNTHKNMCHAKMYTYKSFLQDGDILVVVLVGVDAVDNTSGHILAVQL